MKISFDPKLISQYKLGTVVAIKSNIFNKKDTIEDVGHVIGFGRNCFDEVVVKVQLSSGRTHMYHTCHLQIF